MGTRRHFFYVRGAGCVPIVELLMLPECFGKAFKEGYPFGPTKMPKNRPV